MIKSFVWRWAVALTFSTPALAEIKTSEMVQGVVENALWPSYAAVNSSAGHMGDTMKTLCDTPSSKGLGEARSGFRTLVEAWSEVEMVRFGPVTESNRLERFLFWPDRKSTGLKQVQAILTKKDESAANPATLAGKSVAVQGLGALEFVLFAAGSDELAGSDGAFRCAYGRTVVEVIHISAESVNKAWRAPGGIARAWKNPGPDNPLYRTEKESLEELLDTVLQGLEMVRDVRIAGFLGQTANEDRPKQAIYWRSGQTLHSIAANLDGLSMIIERSRLRERLPENSRWMADSIVFEFKNARRVLFGLLDEPIADILASREKRAELEYVSVVTISLSKLIGQHVNAVLGITSGFSPLDGD